MFPCHADEHPAFRRLAVFIGHGPPLKMLDLKADDLGPPKSSADEERQDRTITQAERIADVRRVQKFFGLFDRQPIAQLAPLYLRAFDLADAFGLLDRHLASLRQLADVEADCREMGVDVLWRESGLDHLGLVLPRDRIAQFPAIEPLSESLQGPLVHSPGVRGCDGFKSFFYGVSGHNCLDNQIRAQAFVSRL